MGGDHMAASTKPGTNPKSRLVIGFDADDTLWQNEIFYRRAGEQLKELMSGHADPARVETVLAETEIGNVRWYGYGIKSFTLSMLETATALSDGKISAEVVRSIFQIGRDMLAADVLVFDDARPTLNRLAEHHDLLLITKGDLLEQDSKIRRSGLADFFRHTDIVLEKSPQAYQALLERHDLSPDHFLMVGNSLKSDILPVLQIGARAVYIASEHTWIHERVDAAGHTFFELERLAQLPELVATLDA